MHWLVTNLDGFSLLTHHNSLTFLVDPMSAVPDMSQITLRKFLRWALWMGMYSNKCYRINGEYNVWEDILTCWFSELPTVGRLVHNPELSSACAKDFE